jgi:P4 family phage/plasmid primase-like protien
MIPNSTDKEMSDGVPPLRHTTRNQFLSANRAGSGANDEKTHTRMPNKGGNNLEDKGGKFLIEKDSEPEFYHHYFNEVVQNGKLEYLTEKQLGEGGPVAVDLDFRFDPGIRERQHNAEDIQDIISIYLEVLKTMFTFVSTKSFMIYVFEKPNVNTSSDEVTKDGIHIIIGIQMSSLLQTILRDKVLEQIASNPNNIEVINDLPLISSCPWKTVLDEGISKGCIAWTLYGSRKPNNDAYGVTAAYQVKIDDADGEFCTEEMDIESYHRDIEEFKKLSVRYRNHPKFELTPETARLLETKQNSKKGGRVMNRSGSSSRLKVVSRAQLSPGTATDPSTLVPVDRITTKTQLDEWQSYIERTLDESSKYSTIRDTHRFALMLPDKFYGDGTYAMWMELAFALKNTDADLMFITWALVSAKKPGFDYGSIPDLYNRWDKIDKREGGKTDRSVRYWAKEYNRDGYNKVNAKSLEHYIMNALDNDGDHEICKVLRCLCSEQFVCSGLTIGSQVWYEFKEHRWTLDDGLRLRADGISNQLHEAFYAKQEELLTLSQRTPVDDARNDNAYDKTSKHTKAASNIMQRCHSNSQKNHLAKEAAELFFSKDFNCNLDQNKWTLCFNNGIVNLQTGEFRDGRPLDYISKTTNVPYLSESDIDSDENQVILTEITAFMSELFPDAELLEYMWEHLASTLVGANLSQTFNIYKGGGSNGKSLLAILMSKALGEYCTASAPLSIITSKRSALGGTSSELYALKSIRYAIFSEPSKGMVLNEGAMKEMTGDAKIQARELYQSSTIFNQMFSLAVCTNSLFEIKSNDDGTWRRLRIIDFKSCFKDPDVYDALPEKDRNSKYIFKKVSNLEHKLDAWAPVFVSLLVRRCIKNKGIVKDCAMVLNETKKYRLRQDLIGQFVDEKIRACEGRNLKRLDLSQEWKRWLEETQSSNAPKMSELCEYLSNIYDKHGSAGWAGVEIVYEPPPEQDAF